MCNDDFFVTQEPPEKLRGALTEKAGRRPSDERQQPPSASAEALLRWLAGGVVGSGDDRAPELFEEAALVAQPQ